MSRSGRGKQRSDGRRTRPTHSTNRRGQDSIQIKGDVEQEVTFRPMDAVWLFVYGTLPFVTVFGFLLWYDPSNVIATIGFWFTAIPVAVALPLAIIGSIYHRVGRRRS